MSRVFEYFVVCGLGPEIRTVDGSKGFHGNGVMYLPSLLDQYPPSTHSLYPPPPPQLSTCVLPAGVEFFSSGFDVNDESTFPRSYPIVLTVQSPPPVWYTTNGALFNYLFPRAKGGKFVLRIEDTDLERSTKESEAAVLQYLTWLGLNWDEVKYWIPLLCLELFH